MNIEEYLMYLGKVEGIKSVRKVQGNKLRQTSVEIAFLYRDPINVLISDVPHADELENVTRILKNMGYPHQILKDPPYWQAKLVHDRAAKEESRPPQRAIILLKIFLPKSDDAMIGDMTEKFEDLAKSQGVEVARRYFWWHTVMSVGPILVVRVVRLAVWLRALVGG